MSFFNNSSHFTIKGRPTLNHVRGDQINSTVNIGTVHFNGQAAKEHSEYDEFEYVKRGHVITLKELDSDVLDVTEFKLNNGTLCIRDVTRKKTFCVELVDRKSKFLAFVYEGEEARRFWENDFQKFSRDKDPNSCQLFGLNRSEIPMLIFHHDLIPLNHFFTKSFWMDMYIGELTTQMQCPTSCLWMDSNKGALCTGPYGPYTLVHSTHLETDKLKAVLPSNVPSTVDMLDDGAIFNFFRQFQSKDLACLLLRLALSRKVANAIDQLLQPNTDHGTFKHSERQRHHVESFFPSIPYQHVVDTLYGMSFDTIYSTSLDGVARWPGEAGITWTLTHSSGLVDKRQIRGGLTRFTFDLLHGRSICLFAGFDYENTGKMAWLSQSPCCTENGANEGYFFVDPGLLSLLPIESTDEYTGLAAFFRLCDRGTPPPIYLFLRPLSLMNMSEVISWTSGQTQSHFWSLDEEGRSQLTEQELEQLGVPELRPSTWLHVELISWFNDTYTALRDWQVAHGFDPATTDFTRYLELPELDILRRKTRFEEVVADEEPSSSWWEAIAGSGISAFAF